MREKTAGELPSPQIRRKNARFSSTRSKVLDGSNSMKPNS